MREPAATGPRRRPQTQRPPRAAVVGQPRREETRGRPAGKAASARAPPAPWLPWGPGPASSPCGRWRRPGSRGPREARAPGAGGVGGWAGGGRAVGGCGRAALTRVCAAPWSRASRRGPTSLPSGRVLGAQASLRLRPRTCLGTLAGDGAGPRSHLPPSAPLTWIVLFIFNLL